MKGILYTFFNKNITLKSGNLTEAGTRLHWSRDKKTNKNIHIHIICTFIIQMRGITSLVNRRIITTRAQQWDLNEDKTNALQQSFVAVKLPAFSTGCRTKHLLGRKLKKKTTTRVTKTNSEERGKKIINENNNNNNARDIFLKE